MGLRPIYHPSPSDPTIQVVLDPDKPFDPDGRKLRMALFDADGTPVSSLPSGPGGSVSGISDVPGLQAALDELQASITDVTVSSVADVPGLQSSLNLLQASATAATDAELSAAIATVNSAISGKQDAATAATDAELTAAINTINTSLAAKQDASSAATDAELGSAVSTINTSLGAKQPLSLEGTKVAMPVANTVPAKTAYFANDENGGTWYRSDGVTAAASPAGWTKTSPGVLETGGRELAYAEIVSNFTTSSTSAVDVPGLSVNPTVGARPILIELWCYRLFNTGPYVTYLDIMEGATLRSRAEIDIIGANQGVVGYARRRLAPAAGAYTYKAVLISGNAAGTATVTAAAAAPTHLEVTER